jgi:NAD(P)-dependent dehydrogenase (short-subunit alcohol dehydrogenase family)
MNVDRPVWLITGASSGLGRELALNVIDGGGFVVAAARGHTALNDLERMRPEQVLATPLDVTNPSDVHQAIEDAVRRFGHIDVLVNNAGFGLFGALEELSEEDLRREFETNVFGALHAIRAVLPHFRARRSGHIVQVSSLEGLAPGLAAESAYAGSKFAMEGVCEGLAEELVDLGIRVTIVEPGPIRTEFGAAARVVPPAIADYDSSVGRALDAFAQLAGNQPNEPGLVARAIITAIESPEPPLRLVLGLEAVQAVREKLARQLAELDEWASLATTTSAVA